MEDGVKGDPAQPKDARFLSKAGWVKKASGRFMAVYKDRYVHVEKTELVVYENEDLKTCLQRLDLENFERCFELKSFFKKKNRLILVREPKCGNKIQDVKFQAQTPEEKDSWIKALSEGINRAKNKIFDEVKVDESNNLDHVTRTRPKGNRARRPPTRIHMKEVASSDGTLPLHRDEPDAALSNGNTYANVEIKDPPKQCQTPPMPPSSTSDSTEVKVQSNSPEMEEPQSVVEPKKVFKPPMPPSKDIKEVLATGNGPSTQADPEKVPGPPKPPSKELKPSVTSAVEDIEDLSEGDSVPEADEETDPLVTPPTEPMSSSPDSLAMDLSPLQKTGPPTIPSKDKKPGKDPERVGSPLMSEDPSDETVDKVSEMDQSSSLPTVQKPEVEDMSTSPSAEELPKVLDVTPEPISNSTPSGPANAPSSNKPQVPSPSLESSRKSPSPKLPLKKKPLKPPKSLSPVKPHQPEDQPTVSADTIVTQLEDSSSSSDTAPSVCSTHIEETPEPTTESHGDNPNPNPIPTVVLSLSEPEEQQRLSCHSEGDSVDSGSEDTLASSTFALRGSQVGLDSVYASEDEGEDYNNPEQIRDAAPEGTTIPQVSSSVQINLIRQKPKIAPRPPIPLRPIFKAMSASVGDLLSDMSAESPDIFQRDGGDGLNEVQNLERDIARGLKQTKELLSSTAQTQGEGLGKNMPEDLLAKAMEKLRMADHFLREAKNLEQSKRPSTNNRSSW